VTASALVSHLLEQDDLAYQAHERMLDAQRRKEPRYLGVHGEWVETPKRDTKKAAGRNSVTMSRNRNIRRKSFGYLDYRYSVRDRGWPT
jgi:hypothetical protein